MFDYLRDPDAIYQRSFAIIRAETDLSRLPADLVDVVIRVVHAAARPEIAADLAWEGEVAGAARAALSRGAPVIADTRMVAEGVIRRFLPAGNEVLCALDQEGAALHAKAIGNTRAAAGLDLLVPRMEGAVVVIGNAPTALFRLIERLAKGAPPPAAIFAFPIGFVGAAESKQALIEARLGVPYLALKGRQGGSALAAAAVNGLAGTGAS